MSRKKKSKLIITTKYISDDRKVIEALLLLRGYKQSEIDEIMRQEDVIQVKSDKAA